MGKDLRNYYSEKEYVELLQSRSKMEEKARRLYLQTGKPQTLIVEAKKNGYRFRVAETTWPPLDL